MGENVIEKVIVYKQNNKRIMLKIIFDDGSVFERLYDDRLLAILKKYNYPESKIIEINVEDLHKKKKSTQKKNAQKNKKRSQKNVLVRTAAALTVIVGLTAGYLFYKNYKPNSTTNSSTTSVSTTTIDKSTETSDGINPTFKEITYSQFKKIMKQEKTNVVLLTNEDDNLTMYSEMDSKYPVYEMPISELNPEELQELEKRILVYSTPCMIISKNGEIISYGTNLNNGNDVNNVVQRIKSR